jgi:prephenate dehydrogenase
MRIAILGLGLIGGSVARALRATPQRDWTIVAWSQSGSGPRAARDAGVVDRVASSVDDAVDGAEVVLVAAPPVESLELLDRLGRASLAPDCVVTDAVSTKRAIVTRAANAGLPFVGGHPMAGRETSGFAAADATLFVDRPWVVCADGVADALVGRVEHLVRAVGAVPVRMSPEAHDAATAAVSHLPLVASAALVESVLADASVNRDDALRLAASGWRDMTRLARGDTTMGAGIVATNGDMIATRLHALRDVIDRWLAELERGGGADVTTVERRLADARRSLDVHGELDA